MYFNFPNGMNRNDNIEQCRPCGYPGNNGFPGNGGCPDGNCFPGSGRFPEDDFPGCDDQPDQQALRGQWNPGDSPVRQGHGGLRDLWDFQDLRA